MKKRGAFKKISFAGALARSFEQIVKENLNYKTVQVKVFANCEVTIPKITPEIRTNGAKKFSDQDERLFAYIKQFSQPTAEVYKGDGKQHLVDVPKKVINIIVTESLYNELDKANLIVK
jgi:hypothetical protein